MRALHTRYSTVPLRHRQHKMYTHIVRPHLAAVRAHHSQLFTPYRDTVKRADTRDAVGTPYGGALMSRSKAFPVDGLRWSGTSPTDKSYRGTNDTVTKHGSGTHLKYSSHRIRSQSLRSAFQGEFGAASPAFPRLSTLLFFPCAVARSSPCKRRETAAASRPHPGIPRLLMQMQVPCTARALLQLLQPLAANARLPALASRAKQGCDTWTRRPLGGSRLLLQPTPRPLARALANSASLLRMPLPWQP